MYACIHLLARIVFLHLLTVAGAFLSLFHSSLLDYFSLLFATFMLSVGRKKQVSMGDGKRMRESEKEMGGRRESVKETVTKRGNKLERETGNGKRNNENGNARDG